MIGFVFSGSMDARNTLLSQRGHRNKEAMAEWFRRASPISGWAPENSRDQWAKKDNDHPV
jgi:hypothetical protein